MIPYGKWLASNNEEEWACDVSWDTKEEAIAGGPDELSLESGESFFVGLCCEPELSLPFICVYDHLIESEDCSGDWAEDFLRDATKEERADMTARLDAALKGWFEAHPRHKPGWFVIRKTSVHVYHSE